MTTEQQLTALENQLARANRRSRVLLALGCICLVLLLVTWAFGPIKTLAQSENTGGQEICASAFVVVDENGDQRARLDLGEKGRRLTLYDNNGEGSASLKVHGLYLRDENGETRVSLSSSSDFQVLSLSDENGKCRAQADVSKFGSEFYLADENGRGRVLLNLSDDGPALHLADSDSNIFWSTP